MSLTPFSGVKEYSVAYFEVDESAVDVHYIPEGNIGSDYDVFRCVIVEYGLFFYCVSLFLRVVLLVNSTFEYRYPRAGRPNAESELCIVRFEASFVPRMQSTTQDEETSSAVSISNRVEYRLQTPLKQQFPWLEYAVRVWWDDVCDDWSQRGGTNHVVLFKGLYWIGSYVCYGF